MELKGVLLCQPWGMYGVQGLAAKLYTAVRGTIEVDPKIPFGEYIIGGDKFYETYVETNDEYINKFFKSLTNKELGETAFCEFGNTLPFSIKVLSLRVPAPFRCNPKEEKGNLFHSKNAKIFVTGGERQTLLIALTDFSLILGFRSMECIIEVLENVPEFRIIIDTALIDTFLTTKDENDFIKVLKDLLDNLPSKIEHAGKLLKDKLLNSAPSSIGEIHPFKLFEKLYNDNPCDAGIFLPYFFNVVRLKPFEGMIIPAGIPYAYLYGQAIEVYNPVENAPTAAFCFGKELDCFSDSLDLHFWNPGEIRSLSVEIRSVEQYLKEYLTLSPFYRVFIGSIPGKRQRTIPQLLSFSIMLIIDGYGKINNNLQITPGAAYLFFTKQKITFHTFEKVRYILVSINILV